MTASSPSTRSCRPKRARGFTLTELAVVIAIVALLLGGVMYTLAAQTEQRQRDENSRRLSEARELLLAFAVVHGRLPCPAAGNATGVEADAPAGSGQCTAYLDGFLPGQAIGFQPVDESGYALDAWGNRLRYALARTALEPTTTTTTCAAPVDYAFSVATSLKGNGLGCAPANLVVCSAAQNTNSGVTPPSCGTWAAAGDARVVTNQRTVAAVVFSVGKNATLGCTTCPDEAENVDGDGVFVWHEPRPTGATGGEFDDMVVWIPASVVYAKLLAAGVLP